MPNKFLPAKVKEMGFCCIYGWMKLQQGPAQRRMPRYGATRMSIHLDCSIRTIYEWRKRFDSGQCACEGQAKCLKRIWAKGDPEADSMAYLSYRWPCLIIFSGLDEGKPLYIGRFRDFNNSEVIVPKHLDLDTALSDTISEYIKGLIERVQDIPKPSPPQRGERYIHVTQALGPKLRDYLDASAKMKRRMPPSEFN